MPDAPVGIRKTQAEIGHDLVRDQRVARDISGDPLRRRRNGRIGDIHSRQDLVRLLELHLLGLCLGRTDLLALPTPMAPTRKETT